MGDKLREMCGIFGVFGVRNASELVYLGLYALQHRGQESAGITSTDGTKTYSHKGLGLVSEVFGTSDFKRLKGDIAIGHNRYSTSGSTTLENAQPLVATTKLGNIAVAHNGNLVNASELRLKMEYEGSIFQTTSDSEVFIHLIAQSKERGIEDAIISALDKVKGAYSILFLIDRKIIAVRDPHGFRPLCSGRLRNGGIAIASESCALDIVEAKYERNIEAGEVFVLDDSGVHSYFPFPKVTEAICIFELIYFARPDSIVYGVSAEKARREFGRQLAREHPAEADIVIAVPDSSNSAAKGYSEESGIPLEFGLIRNHYIGRTFIHPAQAGRDIGARIKYNPVLEIIQGKRVVIVDDSIVRGSTSKKLIRMVRKAGAKEIHLRISSPPIKWSCFYGIDTPTRKELIASKHTIEEIKKRLKVESLGYLSLEGMLKVAPEMKRQYCSACFSGNYPVPIYREIDKFEMEKEILEEILIKDKE